jgi:hypothetical protein
MQISPFDPTPISELSDPNDWFAKARLAGPDVGKMLALSPLEGAKALAAAGVPPPPMPTGGRTGGAQLPTPEIMNIPGAEGMPSPPPVQGTRAPTPPAQTYDPQAQKPLPKQEDRPPQQQPPGGYLQPGEVPTETGVGRGMFPEQPDVTAGQPTSLEPPAPGTKTSTSPTDWQKTIAGLKAIAPPAISPVSSPGVPVPRFDATPNVHFAPQPQVHPVGTINPLAAIQAFRPQPPGVGALLSALLGRR